MAEAPRAAAFFDLDRTLISGSSALYFGIAGWRNGLIPMDELVSDGLNALAFRLFGATDEKSEAVRERILGAVAGHDHADLVALNEDVIRRSSTRSAPRPRAWSRCTTRPDATPTSCPPPRSRWSTRWPARSA
jgi:FMN phosphatase YigB (HAD superfamily)